MIKLIGRLGARLGASALVAAAGLAVTAMPASAAAGVDLAVTVKSGVVASGSAGKAFTVKVTNLGDTKSNGFGFVLETTNVDASKVTVTLPDDFDEFCEAQTKKFVCDFGNVLVRNDSLEIPVLVVPVGGAVNGAAGNFSVTATSDEDASKGNNSVSVPVTVSEPGVDIVVWAEDVAAGRDDATGEAKKIAPGGTGDLVFGVANGGSLIAGGIEIVFNLPQHVSFVETPDDCTVSGQKVTCTISDLILEPNKFVEASLPVKVASNAPQSVELKGTFDGRSLGVLEAAALDARRAGAKVPGWAKVAANAFNPNEVDNKDNSDDFVVFVGTGGSGGGLPITGPKAIVIGGVGAAVLALGVVMLLSARRRRVLLVTPAE